MPLFGYARVSTNGQDLAAQDAELMAFGCAKVFKEKVSGARTDRPELAKVISRLEPGDVLVVTRLDRLARSTRDLLNVLDELANAVPAFVRSGHLGRHHDAPRQTDADGARRPCRVRALVDCGAYRRGSQACKDRGVRFGRPRKMTAHQRQEVLQRLAAGETMADVARTSTSMPDYRQPGGLQPFRARRGRAREAVRGRR